MKHIILFFLITLAFSCQQSKPQTIEEQSVEIAEIIKSGNVNQLKNHFYSPEYVQKLPNFTEVIEVYHNHLKNIKIDEAKNVIVEKRYGFVNGISKDSLLITTAFVPLDVEMPSVVPKYFLELYFVENNGEQKLVSIKADITKSNEAYNEVPVFDKIYIDKNEIYDMSFMYEGGYKNPLVFKNKKVLYAELNEQKKDFDLLLKLLNNAEITETKKETDTRRFNGDPEFEIIHINLKNNFHWTLFSFLSEQPGKPEHFKRNIELRYYEKFLNIAVTYWIKTEDDKLLQETFHKLCQSGDNIRTEPKKTVKLQIVH